MVVTCPECGSRYAVDPLAIGPAGRMVQCVRCDHRWFHKESAAAQADKASSPLSARTVAAPSPPVAPSPTRKISWRRPVTVATVVVAVAAAALFAFRNDILTSVSREAQASTPDQIAAAPAPLAVDQAAPGLSARPARPAQPESARPSIEVDLAASKIDLVDGRYVVRGQLVNNGTAAGSTTLLKLTFKKNEDILGERSLPLVEGPLPPGGRASFTQTLEDPPAGTTDIVPAVE